MNPKLVIVGAGLEGCFLANGLTESYNAHTGLTITALGIRMVHYLRGRVSIALRLFKDT